MVNFSIKGKLEIRTNCYLHGEKYIDFQGDEHWNYYLVSDGVCYHPPICPIDKKRKDFHSAYAKWKKTTIWHKYCKYSHFFKLNEAINEEYENNR